ncbi:DNA repair protein Rad55p [Monosporozyma unispora]
MSLGVPLSQLLSSNPRPLTSGIETLDNALDDGFYKRSIYEIFGVPGIGKTQLAKQLVTNMIKGQPQENILWIDTNKIVNMSDQEWFNEKKECNIFKIRIKKFSELIFYFQQLLKDKNGTKYSLIIIDGFSQLVVNYLNVILSHGGDFRQLHDIKCKRLIVMMTLLTKYTHANNSIVILLDDCMNTSYQWENNASLSGIYNEDNLDVLDHGNNFLVSDRQSLYKRKNVQNLKSALIANCAMGNKDTTWEIFIKNKIGLYWDWINKDDDSFRANTSQKKALKCILAIVQDPKTNISERSKKRRRQAPPVQPPMLASTPSSSSSTNSFGSSSFSQVNEANLYGPIQFVYSAELKKFTTLLCIDEKGNSINCHNSFNKHKLPKQAPLSKENVVGPDDTVYDSQG